MRSGVVRWGVVALVAVALVIAAVVGVIVLQRTTSPAAGGASTPTTDASARASDEASGVEASPVPSIPECDNDVLVLGTLLPQTGDLAFLGRPGAAAVDLALADIDAAGGVLGAPVSSIFGDSGDAKTGLASETVAEQIARGVQAIVGPAASAVTLNVLDQTAGAGTVLISPANTSPGLTEYPDDGLYFRTVPSDVAQGSVLAAVAGDLDLDEGATIARADPYGLGIQAAFEQAFIAGGGNVVASVAYVPDGGSVAGRVAEIAAADPEVVMIAGFSEVSDLLREMIRQGIGPQEVQVLLAEGGVSSDAFSNLPEDVMAGVLGAVPTDDPASDVKRFHRRLLEQDPDLTTFAYAAQTYDAVALVALAAEYAGCAGGRAIAEALPRVANASPTGRECRTYAECREVIASGEQPTYLGVSGPRDFNEFGDARWASVEVIRYVSNTKYRPVEVIGPVEVPVP